MTKTIQPNYYYKAKTKINNDVSDTITIFKNENIFEARNSAFQYVSNLLEILFEAQKLILSSDILNDYQLQALSIDLEEKNLSFQEFIHDSRFLAINLIPNVTQSPNKIEIYFVSDEVEYLIQSYQDPTSINFTEIIDNLRTEYYRFLEAGYNLIPAEVTVDTEQICCCEKKEKVEILQTDYGWHSPIRILGINLLYNSDAYSDKISQLLVNPNFEEIAFLETWNWDEISTNILSLHHTKGGILFMGYHPENFMEHVIPTYELEDTIDKLDIFIQQNLKLSDSAEIKKINFKGFDILAIIVFPISRNNYRNLINSNHPIYIRTDEKIISNKNLNQENNNQLDNNTL